MFLPGIGLQPGVNKKRTVPKNSPWRHHPDLNWGVKVLQTSALPLGYGAVTRPNIMQYTGRFVKWISLVAGQFVGQIVPQISEVIVALVFHDDLAVVSCVDEGDIQFSEARVDGESHLLIRRIG